MTGCQEIGSSTGLMPGEVLIYQLNWSMLSLL